MKKYFITGIVILAPLFVTIAVFIFLFNLLTEPFAGAINAFFDHYGLLNQDLLIFTSQQVKQIVSQMFVLVFLFCITLLLGVFARYLFLNSLMLVWDYIIHKIPFVSSIYKGTQEIVKTIFHPETNSFKQVVLVPFPHPGCYTIGLVTRDSITHLGNREIGNRVSVFVPTTPNPTSGFLVLFEKEKLLFLDMKVEDAFKYVITCGVILGDYTVLTPDEAYKLADPKNSKE